jgi:cyclohexadieny/prephenate dehydrogenase
MMRAARIARLLPGTLIGVEVVGNLAAPVGHLPTIGDFLPRLRHSVGKSCGGRRRPGGDAPPPCQTLLMRFANLLLVGVGLIGGSLGLAARRRGAAGRVVGVDRDPAALEQAIAEGILDEARADLDGAAAAADLVVVCTPVDSIPAQVLAAAAACRPGALLTDVGSTKAGIVEAVRGRLPPGVAFIGSHPLAGSEKHGPAHASADLFEGRLVVLTPAADADDNALARLRGFWQDLGARVRLMEAREHDRALALTSHLPHLLASALASALPPDLYELTATGFRDTTRLAAGNPALWTAIFRANREAVLDALDLFEDQLRRFRRAVAAGDEVSLNALLQVGKTVRDRLAPP